MATKKTKPGAFSRAYQSGQAFKKAQASKKKTVTKPKAKKAAPKNTFHPSPAYQRGQAFKRLNKGRRGR